MGPPQLELWRFLPESFDVRFNDSDTLRLTVTYGLPDATSFRFRAAWSVSPFRMYVEPFGSAPLARGVDDLAPRQMIANGTLYATAAYPHRPLASGEEIALSFAHAAAPESADPTPFITLLAGLAVGAATVGMTARYRRPRP